jgi:probable F420-dependent oxidoreductase
VAESPKPVGGVGVRSRLARNAPAELATRIAAEVESLGYSALWVGGAEPDTLEERLGVLLDATSTLIVGTSVASIWAHDAAGAVATYERLNARHPGRLILGFGVSHPVLVARTGDAYRKPLAAMAAYLDRLDAAGLPTDRRILGALGPRMLELSRDRSLGTVPFLVAPEHTALEREIIGADAVLAPTIEVVLDVDPSRARARARHAMSFHLTLPNYIRNLKRVGFTDADVADGGSDALVDRVAAWGDEAAVRERIAAHQAAGADHVALEIVTDDPSCAPFDQWRRLAPASR